MRLQQAWTRLPVVEAPPAAGHLERRMGFAAATTTNVIAMIGAGPFLTIPLLLQSMHGPQAMLGWLVGAIVAMADGLVWAELGAAMPRSGGVRHARSQKRRRAISSGGIACCRKYCAMMCISDWCTSSTMP